MSAVAFSRDGELLAGPAEDGRVMIWRGMGEAEPLVLSGDALILRSVDFSPDGRLVAASSLEDPLIVWDLAGLRRTLSEMGLGW